MLNSFLLEKHTDGEGTIMIDDSAETLKLTASLIKEDAEIDFECMVSQVLESGEIREYCEALILQDVAESVHKNIIAEEKATRLLKELIESKLRSI